MVMTVTKMVLIVMMIITIIVLMKIKMMEMAMILMVVVMVKEVVMGKMMLMIVVQMMILIYKVLMVLKANYCNPILLAFPQFLMRIYQFLVQLYVNNLCIIKMCRVIRLYKPSYNISLSSIFWFHLYRIFIGNHLPSRFYIFA